MIITLILCNINEDEINLTCRIDQDTLDKFKDLLVDQYVFYRFHWNKRTQMLQCELLNIHSDKRVVLWPSQKLPFRKYPVDVYLYAIAVYLSENISMRAAAKKTRDKFKCTFSHSTLSRSLKKLSQNINDLSSVAETIPKTKAPSTVLVKRKRWHDGQSEEYGRTLNVIDPILTEGNNFGAVLGYRYYNMCQKFIL